jgi:hypothetical protein
MRPGRQRETRSVHQRTAAALAGAALVILPAVTASGPESSIAFAMPDRPASPPLGPETGVPSAGVDGSLPQPPAATPLLGGHADSGPVDTSGPQGIPASMLKAYRNAADLMGKERQSCRLDWALVASIGRIESNHARGGHVDAKGNTLERILGPALDGSGGFAAIPAVDGGVSTGDPVWDHAVGAMQFITGTWQRYASDGNGDGVSDPNNVYDETVAAARYLCSGGLDLSADDAQRTAVRRYNNSQSYVDTVMAWATRYRGGVSQVPDSDEPVGAPPSKPAESAPSAVPVPAAPTVAAPSSPVLADNPPSSSAPAGTQLPATTKPPTNSPAPSPTTTPSTPASGPTSTTAPSCVPPSSASETASPSTTPVHQPSAERSADTPVCLFPTGETTSSSVPAPR